jgi:hypothetical protein
VTPRANGFAGSGVVVVVVVDVDEVGDVVEVAVEPDAVAVVVTVDPLVDGGLAGSDGDGFGPVVEVVAVRAASSDVHAPTTSVAPSARKVRRESLFTGRAAASATAESWLMGVEASGHQTVI